MSNWQKKKKQIQIGDEDQARQKLLMPQRSKAIPLKGTHIQVASRIYILCCCLCQLKEQATQPTQDDEVER